MGGSRNLKEEAETESVGVIGADFRQVLLMNTW